MNWGQLKTMAATYTHRPSIDYDSAQTPACSRLTQLLDVQENETIGSGNMTTTPDGNNLFNYPLPPDFGRIKTVLIGGVTFSATTLLDLLNQANGSGGTVTPSFPVSSQPIPSIYAISGSTIYAPASGVISFAYGRQILPIVGDTNTSPILTRYPRVYLYAVIMEAYIQIQDFDAAGGYQNAFDAAVDEVNGLQAFARFDASTRPSTGFGRI